MRLFCTYIALFLSIGIHAQGKWEMYMDKHAMARQSGAVASGGYFLVQLTASKKTSIGVDTMLQTVRKLDTQFIIAYIGKSHIEYIRQNAKGIWQANNLWKFSQRRPNSGSDQPTTAYIRLLSLSDDWIKEAQKSGLQVIAKNTYYLVKGRYSAIEQLAQREEIIYIGFEASVPVAEAAIVDSDLAPNRITRLHHLYPKLDGKGIVVSIQEEGFDTNDIDIRGKEIPSALRAKTTSDHATRMATLITGNGTTFVTSKGVAQGVQIISSDFADLLPDPSEAYAKTRSWIQNHSYGTKPENFYGVLAEAYDRSAIENPLLLHVFSAGNQGEKSPEQGIYAGKQVANLTGNFKMSKNALTVGSVDEKGHTMADISRGPAYDGRVKPEIVTYSISGSSNSAALVSGVAAVLQQTYLEKEKHYPSSAMLKSILITSANDAGKPGLDYTTGYGNVDAFRSVENIRAGRYASGQVNESETDSISIVVPEGVKNLKVTLVWTDPVAVPNSTTALVNDLDMRLVSDKNIWLPWVLNPSPDLLDSTAKRAEDHLNNVEQITVDMPKAGTYVVVVRATGPLQGSQLYTLSYQWDIKDTFEWVFPTGSDNMPYAGQQTGYIRWESSLPATTGMLDYTVDGGRSWIRIDSSVLLSKGYYQWDPPAMNSRARIRISTSLDSYISDEFTMSRPPEVEVLADCDAFVLLKWPYNASYKNYIVYTRGNVQLDTVLITSDTISKFPKNRLVGNLVTVCPLLSSGIPGLRSNLFNVTDQDAGCYIISLRSSVQTDGITLTAYLGIDYQVEQLVWERSTKNGFAPIGHMAYLSDTALTWLDSQPITGLNTYRVRIQLASGEEIVSQPIQVLFSNTPSVSVFPNPVAASGELTIYTTSVKNLPLLFQLMDYQGRTVCERFIDSEQNTISVPTLPPGIYYYRMQLDDTSYSGKLIVQ